MDEGNPDRALVLYERNTIEFSDNFKVHYDYARALENTEQKDKSIQAYKRALELRPWCLRAKRALKRLESTNAGG